MKIQSVYTLISANLFTVRSWHKEPTESEILSALQERFGENCEFINNDRMTFEVIKESFFVSDDFGIGDFVQALDTFYVGKVKYEHNELFEFQGIHQEYGIAKYVKRYQKP